MPVNVGKSRGLTLNNQPAMRRAAAAAEASARQTHPTTGAPGTVDAHLTGLEALYGVDCPVPA